LKERENITIFLTTHYMEEAENCHRVAIIDYGQIIALDRPENLKKQVGGDVITLKTPESERAAEEIKERYHLLAKRENGSLHLEVPDGEAFIPELIANFSQEISSVSLRRPTLEDVFLKLTGRAIREESVGPIDRMREHFRA